MGIIEFIKNTLYFAFKALIIIFMAEHLDEKIFTIRQLTTDDNKNKTKVSKGLYIKFLLKLIVWIIITGILIVKL